MSTNRRAERTKLVTRGRGSRSRSKQRHRKAFAQMEYSDHSRTRKRGWTGTLDLGPFTRIAAPQLLALRVRFHQAGPMTVRGGSTCLRARVTEQLRRDGVPARAVGEGTRCRHGQCASCVSWPHVAATAQALLDELESGP